MIDLSFKDTTRHNTADRRARGSAIYRHLLRKDLDRAAPNEIAPLREQDEERRRLRGAAPTLLDHDTPRGDEQRTP
jgi:hypothetical protein